MFRHHDHDRQLTGADREKLITDGSVIQGMVMHSELSADDRGRSRLRIEVRFKDGQTVEFSEELANLYEPSRTVGRGVPCRFSAGNLWSHSRHAANGETRALCYYRARSLDEDPLGMGAMLMRIGIVGAGIAGLTAAHILSRMPAHEVVLYERESTAGGRASLRDSGEHCPRVFLDDYRDLFRVLGEVRQADATTLSSAVVPLDRFYYTSRGEWVRISRLFGFQAPELALRDRLGITRAGWSSAVLAEYPAAVNTNKYSPGSNWSGPTLAKAAWKVLRSGGALALEGPTDTCLIEPWLTDLAGHGVSICLGSEVSVIEAGSQGIRLGIGQANERFDAVIVTAFIPDVMRMLDASGIEHRLTALDHTHLKAITMILDPREKILRIERPALYHSGGIGLLVQPKARRCIAVCIRGPSNDDEYVVSRVRRDLDLEFPLVDTWVRSNLLPEEGLYTADYVDPARILSKQVRGLYFAGSYVKNSYPVDSAEGACRTALNAVAALKRDLTQAPLAAGTSV